MTLAFADSLSAGGENGLVLSFDPEHSGAGSTVLDSHKAVYLKGSMGF